MTITVRSVAEDRKLQCDALRIGRAYKLVNSYQQSAISRIYLRTNEHKQVNIVTGAVRGNIPNDLYVEVDLEVIVKEKSNA